MPGFAVAANVIRGDHFTVALVRGWTAGGTGAGQVSYRVYRRDGADSVTLVWAAPAAEYSMPPKSVPDQPYRLQGCLYITQRGELAYFVRNAPRHRAFDDPPSHAPGYYRWSADRRAFVRARSADHALEQRCAKEPLSDWKSNS